VPHGTLPVWGFGEFRIGTPTASQKQVADSIQPYMKLQPAKTFVQRVKDAALKVTVGNPHGAIQMLPSFISLLQEAGHKAEYLTSTGVEMSRIVVETLKSEWAFKQKKKLAADRVPFDSERALAALPTIEPDGEYVIGWHFAPSTSVMTSEMFHEISFADAAFMKVGLY